MSRVQGNDNLLSLAEEIFGQTYLLVQHLKQNSITEPSLKVGSSSGVWTSHAPEIETAKNTIAGLSEKLTKLLEGPHGVLHEFVCSNWELGALYTVLEFKILDKIPLDGQAHVSDLALESGIQEEKLLYILRLVASVDILKEVSDDTFGHTVISELLVKDEKYKAFIGFQLFETRVASAHLADSLKKRNEYWSGESGFKHAWGASMYDWHRSHPEKGLRFKTGMQFVNQLFDAAKALFCNWFDSHGSNDRNLVVDVAGKDGQNVRALASHFPNLSFEVQEASPTLITQGQQGLPIDLENRIKFKQKDLFSPQPIEDAQSVLAYITWNLLWNLSDEECVKLLRTFITAMRMSPASILLVNELMSPDPKFFEPQLEKAYRRRDITLMTMHNAKSRTEDDWRRIFNQASPNFKIKLKIGATSHSCRGLWEVRLEESYKQLISQID